MNFAEAAKETTKFTTTENGAVALNTTGDHLLDLFGVIGALREADDSRVTRLFSDAYQEDPLFPTSRKPLPLSVRYNQKKQSL